MLTNMYTSIGYHFLNLNYVVIFLDTLMGQTLQKAAEWTSAREGTGGKLEYTPANENILNKIIQFAEGFGGQNPDESEIQFKQPLTWMTGLNTSHFASGDYITK